MVIAQLRLEIGAGPGRELDPHPGRQLDQGGELGGGALGHRLEDGEPDDQRREAEEGGEADRQNQPGPLQQAPRLAAHGAARSPCGVNM